MKWLPTLRRKLYNRGLVHVLCLSFSLLSLSLCLFLFFLFTMTLSDLTGADAGTKESELAIVEKAKGPTLSVQTTKA